MNNDSSDPLLDDEEEDDMCDEDDDNYAPEYEEDYNLIDGVGFADPGGNSALRAATRDNPRNLPCGECGTDNVLTPLDVQAGYVCDACANRHEE